MAYYRRNTDEHLLSGALRHRVTFLERKVAVKSGITKESWEPEFTCWADIQGLKGREFWAAAAVNREHELRIIIRHRKDIDPAMRLLVDGRVYRIQSVADPTMRHIKLEILAASVTEG